MMVLIRAKVNGSVIDVSEERAQALLKAGIYERLMELDDDVQDDEGDDAGYTERQSKKYKRRDLKAEE